MLWHGRAEMLSTAHSPLARAGLGPMMGVTRASQATVADLLTRLRLAIFAARFGSFLDPNNVRNRWTSALKRAGLPANVRLYDTRHSHATALLNAGNVNLAWVSARLGHTSVQTTQSYYARVLPEAHRQMAEVMENVLERAIQQRGAGTC